MEFKPREYKKITFRFGAGVIVVSLAVETVAPFIAQHEICDASALMAMCGRPALEPSNLHSTERDAMPEPFAVNQTWIASGQVNSMTPNSPTHRYRSRFTIGGKLIDIDA